MQRKQIDAFLSIPYGTTNQERVYWDTFAKVIQKVAGEIRHVRLIIHIAREEVVVLRLKENVKKLLDKCDFTIAVITSKNPNIFWEIGYTEAQGKPLVLLAEEKAQEHYASPVLVSEVLRYAYQGDRLNFDSLVGLKPFLEQAIMAVQAAPKPIKIGTFSNREECDLPALIFDAAKRIYLITTNLSYFADFEGFTNGRNPGKVFAFDGPVEAGVEVNILTMDPESLIAKYRAEQLQLEYKVDSYREELRRSAKRFYQRYKDRENVSIRLYDDLPLQITLIVDNQIVTSVVSRGSRSRNNLHFLLDIATPGARKSFEEHFHEVSAAPSRHISAFTWAQ